MPSFLERLAQSTLRRLIRKGIDEILGKKWSKEETPPPAPLPEPEGPKTHPWRLCPIGQHWVVDHDLKVPPSAKGPGYVTLRRGSCHKNPSQKDVYTAQEFREIAHRYFENLRNDPDAMPFPDELGFANVGNIYDLNIAGWTKFWNETLKSERPLTPDFVKALIASETSFLVLPDTPSKIGLARGPIQITEATRKILQNSKGELSGHLIELTIEESRETDPNIAAGIRWLYHKRHLLERRIKREASWEEAAAEYKGIFRDIGKDERTDNIMNKLANFHKKLKDGRRNKK